MNPVETRNDLGLLWENYLVSERIKFQKYTRMLVYNYFWRTYDQPEIDWIEDRGGVLHGYEFKWNPGKERRAPIAWKKTYEESEFQVIHRENYQKWVRG